jgi:hypothetical protein
MASQPQNKWVLLQRAGLPFGINSEFSFLALQPHLDGLLNIFTKKHEDSILVYEMSTTRPMSELIWQLKLFKEMTVHCAGLPISLEVLDEGVHKYISLCWGLQGLGIALLNMECRSLDLDMTEDEREKPRPGTWNEGFELVFTPGIFPSYSRTLIEITCNLPLYIGLFQRVICLISGLEWNFMCNCSVFILPLFYHKNREHMFCVAHQTFLTCYAAVPQFRLYF